MVNTQAQGVQKCLPFCRNRNQLQKIYGNDKLAPAANAFLDAHALCRSRDGLELLDKGHGRTLICRQEVVV